MEGEVYDYSNEKIIRANNKDIYSITEDEQKRKVEEIHNLKDTGLKGDKLINEIVSKNENMSKRTILSQEKILKKMEKRHKYQVHLADCSVFNITETLFNDHIQECVLLKMRFDTVGFILQSCKFIKNAKTLIFEQTNGYLTSVLSARSSGNVYSLYEVKPTQRMMPFFNYSEKIKSNITYMELNLFRNLLSSNNPYFNFKDNFSNLVVCIKNETDLCMLVYSLIPALKNTGLIVIYARDKEVGSILYL